MTRVFQDNFLGGEFRLAINVQRICRVRLGITSFAPVKNQVGGKEYEGNFRRQLGEPACGFNIHTPRQRRILLGRADNGDGRAVDDKLRLILFEFLFNGGKVEQVKIRACQWAHPPARGQAGRGLDEIIPNQPVRTGNPSQWQHFRNLLAAAKRATAPQSFWETSWSLCFALIVSPAAFRE